MITRMITVADVRRWDPAAVDHAFAALGALRDRLASAAQDLSTPPWTGSAGDAARSAQLRLGERLQLVLDGVGGVRPAVARAADEIVAIRADIADTERLAAAAGFAVHPDGSVHDVRRRVLALDEVGAYLARRTAERNRIAARLDEALRRAVEADAAVAAALAEVTARLADVGRAPAVRTPRDNAARWQALTAAERDRVLALHPERVANLDGIPAAVRDQANRAAFHRDLRRVGRELRASLHRQGGARDRIAALRARHEALAAIDRSLDAGGLLLGYQPGIGNGRAIVATGDPDVADNVVTCVPGTSARLDTIGGDLARTAAVVASARTAAARENTVGITWFGYDAPQSLVLDAPREVFADDAAPLLRSFQDGLRATHLGPPSHNTVLAHSYGTTVVGHTVRDGALDADALVFAGSPGVGVDHVEELHRPPGTVYSTTSERDEIAIANVRPPDSPLWGGLADSGLVDGHGRDPSSPAFGAGTFPADPRGHHGDYWTDIDGTPNPALVGFGRIATGEKP